MKVSKKDKVKSEKVNKKDTSGFYCIPYEKVIRGYIAINSDSKKEAERCVGCIAGIEEETVYFSVYHNRVFYEIFGDDTPHSTFLNDKLYGTKLHRLGKMEG